MLAVTVEERVDGSHGVLVARRADLVMEPGECPAGRARYNHRLNTARSAQIETQRLLRATVPGNVLEEIA
jgi:hypothetical protein